MSLNNSVSNNTFFIFTLLFFVQVLLQKLEQLDRLVETRKKEIEAQDDGHPVLECRFLSL